jgi:hypothetical protein
MVMATPLREISLVYRFEESPNSGAELRIFCRDGDHSFTSSVTDIPSGKLLWSETRGCDGPFFSGAVQNYVRDSLLPLIRFTTRLAKDSSGSN